METIEEIKVYTVTELATKIKSHLKTEKRFLDVYVRGEVSNLNVREKIVYFDIKDENSRIHVVMFTFSKEITELTDGTNIIVHGKLDFYQREGKLNLIADGFYAGGVGEIYLKFERLKERLRAEGLFALEAKKPIPKYIFRVGIATSFQGAVLHDILHALENAKGLEVYIVDTVVQGEEAKNSIVRSIEILNSLSADIILLARGGGSIEDLWAFNEEVVVRSIRNSKVPVITGIGHETDRTLADLAADREFATPSYAGKFIYEQWKNMCEEVEKAWEEIVSAVQSYIEEFHCLLESIATKLSKEEYQRILQVYRTRLDMLSQSLRNAASNYIQHKKTHIERVEILLESVNPEVILKQGYVYVTKDESIVLNGSKLEVDDKVKIHFIDAVVDARVLGKEVEEWKLEKALKRN